jgi:sodium transport system ATP-binding protein
MGVLSDARGLYPRLTARENIVYYGACRAWRPRPNGARRAAGQMLEMHRCWTAAPRASARASA